MTQPETFAMDAALQPPEIILNPGEKYAAAKRRWQGIPSIERAANGRLWATWYSGGKGEDNENHSLLVTSGDDGRTWSEPVAVIDPPGMVRSFDPCVWADPLGRLWWYWCQTCPMPGQIWDGRGGVWAAVAENPGDANPRWSAPRRISHGVALNKAIVTAKGEWLLPTALWWMYDHFRDLDAMRCPGVIASTDQGQTWTWRGGALCDERVFDEPMVAELRDGTLWMLIRTRTGIAESFSMDAGFSWSRGRPSRFASPSSRFHLRRLASGRLLFINHLGNPDRKRSHLTAMLSDDDGCTWPHRLLLDERKPVSYPDAVEGPDGQLRIIYDFDRHGAKEVYMAAITESDIVAGRAESAGARLKALVNKAG
ncbi:MAG TPA: sialidase family protein [Candidatus Brocadiia bacterium]|nr:sialidase family protein [Candidatus Brocadiia bacterium]